MLVRSWLGIGCLLAGCYAEPATHPVEEALGGKRDAAVEPDADAEDGGGDDGDDASAPLRDGSADAARGDASLCKCSDPAKQTCLPTGMCVACDGNEDCAGGEQCLVSRGECVECLDDAACSGKPSASVCDRATNTCVPCKDGSATDCSLVADKNVCRMGECVQCTTKARQACRTDAGGEAVCDPTTFACTKREVEKTPLCGACVSDDECVGDATCVAVPAAGVQGGRVCQPLWRAGKVCPSPYSTVPPQMLASADGAQVQVCTYAISTHTCKAHADYLADCSDPLNSGMGSNARCGVEGADDGVCLWVPAQLSYQCTVPCRNAMSGKFDCPAGVTCIEPSPGAALVCSI